MHNNNIESAVSRMEAGGLLDSLDTVQLVHSYNLPPELQPHPQLTAAAAINGSASKSSIQRFEITEKAPTRAFSWLKTATTAFTFKTLLRHYAKRALTPRSLNAKLGLRRKGHKGWAVWLA